VQRQIKRLHKEHQKNLQESEKVAHGLERRLVGTSKLLGHNQKTPKKTGTY